MEIECTGWRHEPVLAPRGANVKSHLALALLKVHTCALILSCFVVVAHSIIFIEGCVAGQRFGGEILLCETINMDGQGIDRLLGSVLHHGPEGNDRSRSDIYREAVKRDCAALDRSSATCTRNVTKEVIPRAARQVELPVASVVEYWRYH